MGDHMVCPTCSTHIFPELRCTASVGMLTCQDQQGHPGWHWSSQGTAPGIVRWTGVAVVSRSCPARLGRNDGWCILPPDHEGMHSDGKGHSFGDPENWNPETGSWEPARATDNGSTPVSSS